MNVFLVGWLGGATHLLNILMNPVGDSTGARIHSVVFTTTQNGAKTGHAVDVPPSILGILAEKSTTAVTAAGILGEGNEKRNRNQIRSFRFINLSN